MMDLTKLIPIPKGINKGLSDPGSRLMTQAFGLPASNSSIRNKNKHCLEVNKANPKFREMLILEDLGPFRVTGIKIAVESLKAVMEDIRREQPDVFNKLGTQGMLCIRFVAGTSSLSNHAFGCAVDLTVGGKKDKLRDNRVLVGLAMIAPIFHRHGWFWGAGFKGKEDAMHFQVSKQLVTKWLKEGTPPNGGNNSSHPDLRPQIGDEGPEVRRIQKQLNQLDAGLIVDGVFRMSTHLAVIDFQSRMDLEVDGIVGPITKRNLDKEVLRGKKAGAPAWAGIHAGIQSGDFNIPRKQLVNDTLKTKLGEAKERFGTKVTHKKKDFVRGRCSHFGGPEDPRAGSKTDLTDESVASLSDFDFFCAMRWNFKGNKEFWMNQPILIVNPNNEKAVVVRAIDWGPNIQTERTIDVSKSTLSELEADTDDNLLVSFVDQAKWDGFFGPVEVDEDAQVPDSPDEVKLPGKDDIRDLIISRFASAGFGQIQQIAALANAMRESNLNPSARNKTSREDSVGLFQLNRKGGLGTGKAVSFLTNPNNNIDLILSAANRFPAFGLATTLAKAVSIFVHDIERPADKAGETKKRLVIAEKLLDLL